MKRLFQRQRSCIADVHVVPGRMGLHFLFVLIFASTRFGGLIGRFRWIVGGAGVVFAQNVGIDFQIDVLPFVQGIGPTFRVVLPYFSFMHTS